MSDLHSIIITNGKLNIQSVKPIESSVVDDSTCSIEMETKPRAQHLLFLIIFLRFCRIIIRLFILDIHIKDREKHFKLFYLNEERLTPKYFLYISQLCSL